MCSVRWFGVVGYVVCSVVLSCVVCAWCVVYLSWCVLCVVCFGWCQVCYVLVCLHLLVVCGVVDGAPIACCCVC